MKTSSFRSGILSLARLLAALFFLLPLVWIIGAALHPPGVPLSVGLKVLPAAPTLENFSRLSGYFQLAQLSFSSTWISLTGTSITILTASLVAFGVSLLPKPFQQRWIIFLLAVMMLPEVSLWSTRFMLYSALGWIDTPLPLIAPAFIGTSPFFILMYYRAFRRIPREVYDVARIDGAGILQSWWCVALPVALPTTLAVALLCFILYWGDFTSPLLYLTTDRFATLPLALQTLQQLSRSDWSLMMAGVAVSIIVPVLLFLFLMPYFNYHNRRER
jgi:multiple sugar transport system permease protein